MTDDLVAVVLAAGSGRRLAPLTSLLPKALCPVGGRPLVDLAIDRCGSVLASVGAAVSPASVAVNAHHGLDLILGHLADRVHVSAEVGLALGTAGGVGNLRDWIAGRDVLVANADAWLGGSVADFAAGWDRQRVRVLCVPAEGRQPDFGDLRYAGLCLLPGAVASALSAEPSGLYEVVWRAEWEAGRLDVVTVDLPFVDCGTPADYLAANLAEASASAAGGSIVDETAQVAADAILRSSVVGAHAEVHGQVDESVVWPGSVVGPREQLRHGIRAGGLTVLVR